MHMTPKKLKLIYLVTGVLGYNSHGKKNIFNKRILLLNIHTSNVFVELHSKCSDSLRFTIGTDRKWRFGLADTSKNLRGFK